MAGLDVSYVVGSTRVAAAAVAVDLADGQVLEEAVVPGEVTVAYEPGRLAEREAPLLLSALAALRGPVDVPLCDGQGIAHPRRLGLACVVGLDQACEVVLAACTRFRLPDPLRHADRISRAALRG